MTVTATTESDGARHDFQADDLAGGPEPVHHAAPEAQETGEAEAFVPATTGGPESEPAESEPAESEPAGLEPGAPAAHEPLDLDALAVAEPAEEAEEEADDGDPTGSADYADLTAVSRARPPRIADEVLPELEYHIEQAALPSGTSLRHRFAAAEAEEEDEDAEEEPRGLLGRIFRR